MKVLLLAPSILISNHKEHTPDLSLSPSSSSEENNLRHFQKGSLIQLSSGQTKKMKDLETEDLICSARSNPDITLDHSTLVQIELKTTNGFQKVIDYFNWKDENKELKQFLMMLIIKLFPLQEFLPASL